MEQQLTVGLIAAAFVVVIVSLIIAIGINIIKGFKPNL